MNKKMVLMALLLVSVAAAVSGTDFEERITEKKWYRDYFNEVIYRKDRNIIVEYQPYLTEEENIIFYNAIGVIFWFDEPSIYRDRINWTKFDDSEYGSYISMRGGGFSCKAKELNPDLYELEIEDVRISQEKYEDLLARGHDRKFALDATEPGYSLYFRFDGEYLYIYLEDGKTLYATYCAYDESEEEALYEAIRTNEFDMTKITFPRHADGTCDYESGGGVPGKKIVNGVYRAKDNLRLRETGSISGKAITTMQAGSLVLILSKGREETIDGITDNWVQVETLFGAIDTEEKLIQGEVGWCFSGYLK
ncbi:MAG: SH3 domain-containing protein [Candidatus Treponema excrementipullorum]|uniref:SH3 domain-containing protein n=2 Tax=Spirochaetales TaxID=136 RepID=A0A9E2NYM6_9SPIR|nr:SH3 domain-containing protein [Candidatus Treponema excrementipullorum]